MPRTTLSTAPEAARTRLPWLVPLVWLGVPALAAAQTDEFEARVAVLSDAATARGWIHEAPAGDTEEHWCPPPGPCAATAAGPGSDLLVVTRTGLSRTIAHRLTAPSGWRVTVSLGWWQENPPTFDLRFERGDDVLHVGWELHSPALSDGTYISRTGDDVGDDFHAWLRRELSAYVESAASFRERVVRRSDELRAHLRLHARSLGVCDDPHDPGRFVCTPMETGGGLSGHAMMDTCVHRRLTEEEAVAFLAQAEAELDLRSAIARAHATELHAALVLAFGPVAP